MRSEDLKAFNAQASQFILSKAPVTAISGGVRSQKTWGGCVKTAQILRDHPGTTFLIGRKTHRALINSTQKEMVELIRSLKWEKYYNKTEGRHILKNNSELLYWSFEMDLEKAREKVRGQTLGGFWLDEAPEMERELFDELTLRLSHPKGPNQALLTYNPNGHDWLWKMLKNQQTRVKDYDLFEVSTYDNQAYLPEGFFDRAKNLPEEFRKRFIYGSYDVIAGLVFSQYLDIYAPAGHLVEPIGKPPADWPKWRAIDHGYRHPAGCVWITRDRHDIYYVYRTYKRAGLTATENGGEIQSLSGDEKYQYDVMDSACFNNTGQKLTIAEEYTLGSKGKIMPNPSRKSDDMSMINRVAEWLADRNTHDGGPRLRICSDCQDIRDEFVSWKWSEATRQLLRKERPEDANNDLLDPLIYFAIMQNLLAPEREEEKILDMNALVDQKFRQGIKMLNKQANKKKRGGML